MANVKDLELTKDPLTNIIRMIPLLNDESRKAVSYFMYGYCLGEAVADNSQKNQDTSTVSQAV